MISEAERLDFALAARARYSSPEHELDLGVRDADYQVDQIGKLLDELGQRADDDFDPLRRAEQSEGRAGRARPVEPNSALLSLPLVVPHVRDAVWNDSGPLAMGWRTTSRGARRRDGSSPPGARSARPSPARSPLRRRRPIEDRVQRGDARLPQLGKEVEDVGAVRPAEDSVLVLDRDHSGVAVVDEVGGSRGSRLGPPDGSGIATRSWCSKVDSASVIATTVPRTLASAGITASLRSWVNVPIPQRWGGYVPRKVIGSSLSCALVN